LWEKSSCLGGNITIVGWVAGVDFRLSDPGRAPRPNPALEGRGRETIHEFEEHECTKKGICPAADHDRHLWCSSSALPHHMFNAAKAVKNERKVSIFVPVEKRKKGV
jgi:hypothetical protein